MCEWMAETLHNSWKNIDGVRGAVSALRKVDSPGAGPEAGPPSFPTYYPPAGFWIGGVGPPRATYMLGKTRPFCDGAGLTSPGRWPPKRRTYPQGKLWDALRSDLQKLAYQDLGGKDGIQRTLFRLCSRPESEVIRPETIRAGRTILQTWIGRQCGDYDTSAPEIAEGQPFLLRDIFYVLREMRDADFALFKELQVGTTAGILEPLPRNPALFEEQTKWRLQLDPFVLPENFAPNYKSLDLFRDKVEKLFLEEEKEGMMTRMPKAAFLAAYPVNHAISALAVIEEDGGQKIRVLQDATHTTCVNNRIRQRDKCRMPGVADKHQQMRERRAAG